jgi:transcriptional regulator with XRE-family HTH domain
MGRRSGLAARREARGLTQEALAAVLGVATSTVARWEAGYTTPRAWQRRRLSVALDVSLEQLHVLLVPSEPVGVDRAPIARAMRRGRITADVVAPLTAIVDELRRLDDRAGGGRVLPLVQAEIDTVTAMLDRGSYTSGVGMQLHQALADVTQLAGWAAHDAGRRREARRHFAASLYAAHAAGDPLLAVHTMSAIGFALVDQGDLDAALRVLDTALATTPVGRRYDVVRSMLHTWAARAHAARRDRQTFGRSIAEAGRLFEGSDPEHTPGWLYWFPHPEAMAETGRGFLLVGDADRAVTMLGDGASAADEAPRDQVLYASYQAEALIALDDIDGAAEHGRRALRLAGEVESLRAIDHLAGVSEAMVGHAEVPAARAFLDAYDAAAGAR